MTSCDVISMPDTWEYPWYAAWDLAFHCVALAQVDPDFAKEQLLLLLPGVVHAPQRADPGVRVGVRRREPAGARAGPRCRCSRSTAARDFDFLERVLHKLLHELHLVGQPQGRRRQQRVRGRLPRAGQRRARSTGRRRLPRGRRAGAVRRHRWMAMYCLNLLEIVARAGRAATPRYADLATKFFEHFAYIASASYEQGLWDEEDGFFYDVLRLPDGRAGAAAGALGGRACCRCARPRPLGRRPWTGCPSSPPGCAGSSSNRPQYAEVLAPRRDAMPGSERLLSIVGPEPAARASSTGCSTPTSSSRPYGIRSLSRVPRAPAVHARSSTASTLTVDYEPAESRSGLFGGNSNWRGPVWFPVNYLLIQALRRFGRFFGDDYLVEYPTGSGTKRTLAEIADDLADRLIDLYRADAEGNRPVFGGDQLRSRWLARPAAVPRVLPRRHRRRPRAPRTRPAGRAS